MKFPFEREHPRDVITEHLLALGSKPKDNLLDNVSSI